MGITPFLKERNEKKKKRGGLEDKYEEEKDLCNGPPKSQKGRGGKQIKEKRAWQHNKKTEWTEGRSGAKRTKSARGVNGSMKSKCQFQKAAQEKNATKKFGGVGEKFTPQKKTCSQKMRGLGFFFFFFGCFFFVEKGG